MILVLAIACALATGLAAIWLAWRFSGQEPLPPGGNGKRPAEESYTSSQGRRLRPRPPRPPIHPGRPQ